MASYQISAGSSPFAAVGPVPLVFGAVSWQSKAARDHVAGLG